MKGKGDLQGGLGTREVGIRKGLFESEWKLKMDGNKSNRPSKIKRLMIFFMSTIFHFLFPISQVPLSILNLHIE